MRWPSSPRRHYSLILLVALIVLTPVFADNADTGTVTFEGLVREMADVDALARFPHPQFQSLEASSYNRESVRRGEPGWFADSDGGGFLRMEHHYGRTEWVLMEHGGPGVITRIWTPFFYYDFKDRTGPNIRIYLDGSERPVIEAPLIGLVTGQGFVKPPFANFTARAGVLYLPIPFSRSCRITLDHKPFYYCINYRTYPGGTEVRSFSQRDYETATALLSTVSHRLLQPPPLAGKGLTRSGLITPKHSLTVQQASGSGAVRELTVALDASSVARHPDLLRSVVLEGTFDGEKSIWCPIGDFFSSANAIHSFQTWAQSVRATGEMVSQWVMPFARQMELRLTNLGTEPVHATITVRVGGWKWDNRTMHFHANWRSDDILPGTPFQDWNFIDISGRGLYVGDSFTVLSPGRGWWGEGDEKVYVDSAYDAGFPTHFGTGTEDYYGWAGGVVPDHRDVFSFPYGANVSVGSTGEDNPRGFNICTRVRALDSIPFENRLVFDMEASPGVDIRNAWNLLGYSAVVYWYARPGAISNRPPLPAEAAKPIMSLDTLDRRQDDIRQRH